MSTQPPPLILASTSPRRQELLREAGYCFTLAAPPADDSVVDTHLAAGAYVESLAYLKATAAIAHHAIAAGLVLGADTVVELGGRIIGKPTDVADARRILARLSGSTHRVLTGLALVDVTADRRYVAHDVTGICMRRMTAGEIDAYVASGEALGKAGAYAIQETGDRYVEHIDGSLSNVVGLPMALLEQLIQEAGYTPEEFRE
jgi:septum formation protein